MRPVFPAVWLSARGVWGLLGVAAIIALAAAVPLLLVPALLASAAYIALLLADLTRGPRAGDLRVLRLPLDYVALRRSAHLGYRVENRSAGAVRVGVIETPDEDLEFAQGSVEAEVAPNAYAELSLDFTPRERGRIRLAALYVWVESAVGLLRRRYVVDAPLEIRVFPDLNALEQRGKLAQRAAALQAGLRRMRLRGVGSEFESLREYLPGDAFRAIDWKASARRGRLMVEQYEAERNQQVLLLLDAGRLMLARIGLQRKFDYALTAALSMARIAQEAGDVVGLLAFGAKPILSLAPRRGAAHVAALTQLAFDVQPRREEPDYETILTDLKQRYTKRSLVVLFSDMFDPTASAALLAGLSTLVPRHLVMCVLMNDGAVSRALEVPPTTPQDAYRTSTAMLLQDERALALAQLRARGIIVVDVPAAALTLSVLDAYLDVKTRGAL
jgi:uncharacterized protein (DUF58 family)